MNRPVPDPILWCSKYSVARMRSGRLADDPGCSKRWEMKVEGMSVLDDSEWFGIGDTFPDVGDDMMRVTWTSSSGAR